MAAVSMFLMCSQRQWTVRPVICLLASLIATSRGFEPFAGLAELSPQRLVDFCDDEGGQLSDQAAGSDSHGVRRCVHSVQKRLEDGGEVQFTWQLDIDPRRIISLDVQDGNVRLTRCDTHELDIEFSNIGDGAELPVKEGDCVVASRWMHACPHLQDKSLYHCVIAVEKLNSDMDHSSLRLVTMEVPSLAHLANAVDFYFSYVPPEAQEVVRFPRRQTADAGSTWTTVANLGWNWDFEQNATQNPEVSYAVPGGKMILQEPYAKAHVGFFMNFTSRFSSDDLVPRINFEMGMDGHATINARLITELNGDGMDVSDDDLYRRTDLEVLQQLAQIRWLGPFDFSLGSIPVSFEPGFQFASSVHQLGQFRGSLQMGINAHAMVRPRLRFSSRDGLDATCLGEVKDFRLSPPMWMISTKHFEMGMKLEPQMWIRGQLGGIENIRAGLALLPFANLTIRQGLEPEVADDDTAIRRRLWMASDWEDRWTKQHADCHKDRVHFAVGAGFLVRGDEQHMKLPEVGLDLLEEGEIEHMQPPSEFPQIGWLQPLEKGARFKFAGSGRMPGTLATLFPQACAGALCEGTLPVCAEGESRFSQEITWHFNRPFNWDGDDGSFATLVRSEVAHAFSILPAEVEVRLPRSDVRRLSDSATQIDQQRASSVVTSFKEGLSYVADRPLIEMLLSHGHLDKFNDAPQYEQRSLYITGFNLQREGPLFEDQSSSSWKAILIVPVLLILCCCGFALVPKKRRRPAASGVFEALHVTPRSPEQTQDQEMFNLAAE